MKEIARLTVDMSPEEHTYLKMASAKMGISMKELVISSTFKMLEEVEDQWLLDQVEETKKEIKSGKQKLHSWESVKKKLKS